MPTKTANTEFGAVFSELRDILSEYAPKLTVVRDEPNWYYLDTHTIGPNKKPIMFAAIRIGKNYVSYYFMPVYGGITDGLTPALKKHKQGKACFNFKAVDKALFKDVKTLTKRGYQAWKKLQWVD